MINAMGQMLQQMGIVGGVMVIACLIIGVSIGFTVWFTLFESLSGWRKPSVFVWVPVLISIATLVVICLIPSNPQSRPPDLAEAEYGQLSRYCLYFLIFVAAIFAGMGCVAPFGLAAVVYGLVMGMLKAIFGSIVEVKEVEKIDEAKMKADTSTDVGGRRGGPSTAHKIEASDAVEHVKIPCRKCGSLILPTTAAKTDGLCMPCNKGGGGRILKSRN